MRSDKTRALRERFSIRPYRRQPHYSAAQDLRCAKFSVETTDKTKVKYLSVLAFIFTFPSISVAVEVCDAKVDNFSRQVTNVCQLQCALSQGTPQPSAKCESSSQSIATMLIETPEAVGKLLAGCGSGALSAFVENLIHMLAPEEYIQFVRECNKSTECKRGLARSLEQYRARKSDGSYMMSDAEVDKAIASTDFNDLLIRSKHNAGATYDICQGELGRITQKLANEFSRSSVDDELKVRQKRYDLLREFDQDCPTLLKLARPDGTETKPDLKKAFQGTLKASQIAGKGTIEQIDKWFKDLGIAFQCYDRKTQGQLLCYGLGKVFLDPISVAGSGVFAKRALSLTKTQRVERAVAQVVDPEIALMRQYKADVSSGSAVKKDFDYQNAVVYHGTIQENVSSVKEGPKNVGAGFGGRGLYLATENEQGLAREYAAHARDAAEVRVANVKTITPGQEIDRNAVIMQGRINPDKKYKVGVFEVGRDFEVDLKNGRLPFDWDKNPTLKKMIEDEFDIIEITNARKNGMNLDTDRFLVVHERAGPDAIVWEQTTSAAFKPKEVKPPVNNTKVRDALNSWEEQQQPSQIFLRKLNTSERQTYAEKVLSTSTFNANQEKAFQNSLREFDKQGDRYWQSPAERDNFRRAQSETLRQSGFNDEQIQRLFDSGAITGTPPRK